jgi:hypothetical protein
MRGCEHRFQYLVLPNCCHDFHPATATFTLKNVYDEDEMSSGVTDTFKQGNDESLRPAVRADDSRVAPEGVWIDVPKNRSTLGDI